MTGIRKLTVAVAAVGVLVAPLVGATTAQAGSNGQQVKVSTYYSDEVDVCGYNQNGNYACTGWFATPGSGYTGVAGYWFHGTVDISGLNDDTGKERYATCNVPTSQSGNWTYCDGRSNRSL
ncbi:hypothetical protein ACWGLF_18025 [Streptomyces puniciscabiei]